MSEQYDEAALRAKLNSETGKIHWRELQPHYARGVVIRVAQAVDLIEAALRLSIDDKPAFEAWLCAGDVIRANDAHAADWAARGPVFWAVVVAPWVLVQEITSDQTRN